MSKYLKTLLKLKKIDEEKAIIDGIFSSENEDRHGEIVMQNFDLKAYKKNPVILDSHDHHNAESVIGKSKGLKIVDGKLQGKIEFAVNENPKAKVIFDLIKGRYLNAFSIGFIPKEFDDKNNILKSELLEISVVSVPANADALVQAKAKGIDIDILYEQNSKTKKDNGKTTKKNDNNKNKRAKDKKQRDDKKSDEPTNYEVEKTAFIETKEYENWDETNEFVRFKVKDIAHFGDGTMEKITLKESFPQIMATVGNLPKDENKSVQMLFFVKNDGWNIDDAKKWFTNRQMEVMGSPKPNESMNIGKSKWLEAVKEENKKQLNRLNKICEAIKLIGGVDTRTLAKNKADKNKVINKCLKELIKIKKK